MLSVKKCAIKEHGHQLDKGFNYPKIINIYPKNNQNEALINRINEEILEDIFFFKETLEDNIDEVNDSYTEYRISLKKGQIISIAIEFCEVLNYHNITYINTYNYDISKNKKILLKDIFKENVDYLNIIDREIKNNLNSLRDKSTSIELTTYLEAICNDTFINEDQSFYIGKDRIVICFSSYELGIVFRKPVEISIRFDDYKEYFSEYAIDEIWEVI